jgi:hypothetical protein
MRELAMTLVVLGALAAGGVAQARASYYNPTTVVTVRGRVIAVQAGEAAPGAEPDLYLEVQTARGVVDVQLGPAIWVSREAPGITVGSQVTVSGSATTVAGERGIIAAEVSGGARRPSWTLRDPSGAPRWK